MRSLWIDGGWQASSGGDTSRISNPATLEAIDDVVEGTADDVRRAAAAAARASRHWRRMPALERGRLLHDAAGLMRADRAELSKLMTLEGGKPRIENLDEIEWSAACLQYYAEIGRHSNGSSIPPTAQHQINFTIKEPLGVVAAIVPFNYPLLLLLWKIAPALAAGNTVVIKPSELTPLGTLRMVEQALSHLPPGVVNVVTGGSAVGSALVDDPDVACIAFTGSTAPPSSSSA
jgi:acyl-CoA reductase-like NAD-dependent aldehyde dehydrogenase